MGERLKGKTMLLTSAAQGIVRASAVAMARAGAKVYATDIRDDLLESLGNEAPGIEAFVLESSSRNALPVEISRRTTCARCLAAHNAGGPWASRHAEGLASSRTAGLA